MRRTTRVKVGTLSMKRYAVEKPIAIKPDGTLITTPEIIKKPDLAIGSLHALDEKLQIKLAVERNMLEPNFKLGIIGDGIVTKNEVIKQIKAGTELGRQIVRAEMSYCNDLMLTLMAGGKPKWPKIPTPEPAPVPKEWRWLPKRYWRKWHKFFCSIALFCENTTDSVTRYAARYRIRHVHPVFRARGFLMSVLSGADDVRPNFTPIAKLRRTAYVSGVGHGSPTGYTGHLGDTIFKKCSYDAAEVKGKVIHLLSCQTARELGPDLVKKGAVAYAGYYENFTFVYDQPGTPIDEMELFWKSDSTYDIMMACGATAEQAHRATIAMYNAAIAAVPGTVTAVWLTHDRDCFRSPVSHARYGDKKARISPYIIMPLSPFMETEEVLQEIGV